MVEDEKRRRILNAATGLFAHYGYRKTSIAEIAEEAQVGKGTVYLVAKNKEDLFFQVVSAEVAAWCASVEASVDPRLSADVLLLNASITALGYADAHPLVKELLLGNHDEVLPLWATELQELRKEGRAHTIGILKLGIEQGLFRADFDVDKVALLLQNMMAMGLVLAYRERKSTAEQIASSAVALDVLLKGLLVR